MVSKSFAILVSLLLFTTRTTLYAQSNVNIQSERVTVSNRTKVALIVSPARSSVSDATKAVREGIMCAYEKDRASYDLVQYTLKDENQLPQLLNKIAEDGAMLAIGPITKSAVEKVATQSYLPLPVLALNRAVTTQVPSLFLSIDLTLEGETDQLVRIAIENTSQPENLGKNFVIFTTNDAYDQRLARAIEASVHKVGLVAERRTVSNEQLAYLTQEMRGKSFRGVFFAMDSQHASLIRPYLPPELAVFGTTYTNPMNQSDAMAAQTQVNDLTGMITLEIPAVTQMNSEQYIEYKPFLLTLQNDERHMFAVGVDAWNVGKEWMQWKKSVELNTGLSGALSINANNNGRVGRTLQKIVVKPGMENPSGAKADDLVQFEEKAEDAGL